MEEKWELNEKIILCIAIIFAFLGMALGFFWLAPGAADDIRLEIVLEDISLYEPITIPHTTKGEFGDMAEKVIEDYLNLYQSKATKIVESGDTLAYQELKELVENDKKYIRELVLKHDAEFDDKDIVDTIVDILQITEYREEFEQTIEPMYLENVSKLKLN